MEARTKEKSNKTYQWVCIIQHLHF